MKMKKTAKYGKNLIAWFEIALLSLTHTTHRVNSTDLCAPLFPYLPAAVAYRCLLLLNLAAVSTGSSFSFPEPSAPQSISRCFHCNSLKKVRHRHPLASQQKENLSSSCIFTTGHDTNSNMHLPRDPGPMFQESSPLPSTQISPSGQPEQYEELWVNEVMVSMGNSWLNHITAQQSLPLLPPLLQAAWGTLYI